MREIIVNGKKFESIKEACDFYNCPYAITANRYRRGWPVEECLGLVKHVRPDKGIARPACRQNRAYENNQVTVKGKTFASCREACDYFGVPYNTAMKRLERGYTIEDIFNPEYKKKNAREVVLEGKHFKTMTAACKYYHISNETVLSRMNKGCTLEEAFEIGKEPFLVIDSKEFASYAEACRFYSIKIGTFHKRRAYGWTTEEALGIAKSPDKRVKPVVVKGKKYDSIKDACKDYNINPCTVKTRTKNGWTLEDAVCTKVGLLNPKRAV